MNPKEIRANRNRMSAIKSREKKFEKRDSLLNELQLLRDQNTFLRCENERSRQILMQCNPSSSHVWGWPADNTVSFSYEPAAFYSYY